MPNRSWVMLARRALVAAIALVGIVPPAARSQELALVDRGPRFLREVAGGKQRVELDLNDTPVLQRRISLDGTERTLGELLSAIAKQGSLTLIYSADLLPVRRAMRFRADSITVAAALTEVLVGAGVDVVFYSVRQAGLVKRGYRSSQGGSITGRVTDAKNGDVIPMVDVLLEGTRWRTTTDADGRYRLVDVPPGRYTVLARRIGYGPERRAATVIAGQEMPVDVALQARATTLGDVVVTAQKREERLINVPQAVSVLPADALVRSGALQFRDFANTIPGLTITTQGAGQTQLSLRGVTAGVDIGPTVGIYVDEVPYGSSTLFGQGVRNTLDAGLFDMDRIEVLRGPQGTLYGASAMGGLIKYVTKGPDATRFRVGAQTGVSATRDGGASYTGAAVVNAPIVTDKVALRASGFYSRDGGYIDNLVLGEEDVNGSDIYGGRADLLLRPSDALSLRITGVLQDIARDGEGTANYALSGAPLDGSLDARRQFAEAFDQRFRLVSGTVTYDLEWASLTSVSGYQTVRSEFVRDDQLAILCTIAGRSCSAAGLGAGNITDKFTQEVRLASGGTKPVEWVIGGFYMHESSGNNQELVLRDLAGQPVPNDLFTFSIPSRYEEYATFGDLTWHLTSKLNVTGGVRYARNRQKFEQIGSGFFGFSTPPVRSTENVVTYLANARYHFGEHATGYLRYATGYRPGGPNIVLIDPITGLPRTELETFEADRLKSYEVGFKAETADRRFGIDVAGYYIDWSNIQITAVRGGFGIVLNAPGGASIRGGELALTARPITGFTATGAFAYQDAEMSEADPDLGAAAGDRLPNVPRFTATLNADYDLPGGRLQPTVGTTLRHMADRMANFINSPFGQYRLPAYTTVDLRAGFMLDQVNVQLYVRNLFDKRGQLSGISRIAILQPRTIGISLTPRF